MAKVESDKMFYDKKSCDECEFIKDLITRNKKDKFKSTPLEELNKYRTKCANCKKGQLKFDAIAHSMFLEEELKEQKKVYKKEYVIKNRNEGKHWTMTDFELKSLYKMRNQGLSYSEIAEEMNISKTKVYKTYNLKYEKETNKKILKRLKELNIKPNKK